MPCPGFLRAYAKEKVEAAADAAFRCPGTTAKTCLALQLIIFIFVFRDENSSAHNNKDGLREKIKKVNL